MNIFKLLTLLITSYNKADKSGYLKLSHKYEIFRVYLILSLKIEFNLFKNWDKNQKIFETTISAYSYDELLYLFEEIFVKRQYYFESDRLSPKIIDCGANIGMSIIYFKWLYPKCRILAFEPNPQVYKLLKKNISVNNLENIELYNTCLSDKEEVCDFYINENSLLSSLDSGRADNNRIRSATSRLSGFLHNEHVDFVKIDVEGGEWEIIADLEQTKTIQSIRRLIIEYHHKINDRPAKLSKFLKVFETSGFDYKLHSVYEAGSFQDLLISAYNLNLQKFLSIKNGVSILICSHNGESFLPNTLAHLANQKVSNNLNWEILLIDNSSNDDSVKVAKDTWGRFNSNVPFKIVGEYQKGKSHAVDLGLDIAQYSYVLICDDDNWLDSSYVQNAYNIMINNPQIGLLGGKGIPVFESDPPYWFQEFKEYYAVGNQGRCSGEVLQHPIHMRFIWGAGSVINMRAYKLLRRAGFERVITSEKYPELARSEDLEMSFAIQLTGYKLWYDNRLTYRHFISEEKLSWSYLLKITKPGSKIRPYLKLYHLLILGKTNGLLAKNFWIRYVWQWVKFFYHDFKLTTDLKYYLFVLLGYGIKINTNYHRKFALYNEFNSLVRMRKAFGKIQRQIIRLKRNIVKERSMDYGNGQLLESLKYYEKDSCNLNDLNVAGIVVADEGEINENSLDTLEEVKN